MSIQWHLHVKIMNLISSRSSSHCFSVDCEQKSTSTLSILANLSLSLLTTYSNSNFLSISRLCIYAYLLDFFSGVCIRTCASIDPGACLREPVPTLPFVVDLLSYSTGSAKVPFTFFLLLLLLPRSTGTQSVDFSFFSLSLSFLDSISVVDCEQMRLSVVYPCMSSFGI